MTERSFSDVHPSYHLKPSRYEENGGRKVDLELVCRRRQDGRTVVEGWMTFVVPA